MELNSSLKVDPETLERLEQARVLLDQGMTFEIRIQSYLGKFLAFLEACLVYLWACVCGKEGRKFKVRKVRTFTIYQAYLGALDYLAVELLSIKYDQDQIDLDIFEEGKRLTGEHARRMARVVAIAYLNSKWGIRLFKGVVANYFLWRLTPGKLLRLVDIINAMQNPTDFLLSIRLIAVLPRTTAPALMEEKMTEVSLED